MKKLLFFLILFISSIVSKADNIQFVTKVSKNQIVVGERIQVTFEINDRASNFTPPNFKGFNVLSGPNPFASNMQQPNGQRLFATSVTYILQAVQEGDFTIESASIQSGNKKYTSQAVNIKVLAGSNNQQPVNQQQIKSQSGGQKGSSSDASLENDIFLKVFANKSEVYIGEPILINYRIYTRVLVLEYITSKFPTLNGFWNQAIDNKQINVQEKTEVENGVAYSAADIRQIVVIPQRSGDLEIEPMEMTCIVRVRSQAQARSVFDQFFGSYEDKKVVIKTPKLKIKAKTLPEAGKPSYFSGAVGSSFNIGVQTNKTSLKTNEGIDFKINLQGNGNIKLVDIPKPEFAADFEVYDPKIKDDVITTANGSSGNKSAEYLIIPRHSGEFIIPGIKFSYFDPKQKKYINTETPDIKIFVEKGIGEEEPSKAVTAARKEDVALLNKDIKYIKTKLSKPITIESNFFTGSLLFWILLILPFILFIILYFIVKKYELENKDLIKVKSKKAKKIATSKLKKAQDCLNKNDEKAFYEEIFRALYGYISDKFNIPVSELNKENIRQKLNEKLEDKSILVQLEKILETCEMARFAPIKDKNLQNLYNDAADVINTLEDKVI
jgi:hypothetical protein